MSEKLYTLFERRKHLVAEAAIQRLLLAQNIEIWRAPLAKVDRGLAAVRYIKNHPIWIASTGLGLLTVVGPNRTGKWFQRGFVMWQIVRKLRRKSTI
jgi:YqjK-like protein